MNLSETAFVRLADEGPLGLRWFTPAIEVDLCGHATLASAHALRASERAAEGDTVSLLHPLRHSHRAFRRRLDRARLPGPRSGAQAAAGRAARGSRRRSARLLPHRRERLAAGARRCRDGGVSPARLPPARRGALPRHCRHRSGRRRGSLRRGRLRLPLLRPGLRDRRRSGDRLGALRPGAVLGEAARSANGWWPSRPPSAAEWCGWPWASTPAAWSWPASRSRYCAAGWKRETCHERRRSPARWPHSSAWGILPPRMASLTTGQAEQLAPRAVPRASLARSRARHIECRFRATRLPFSRPP